MPDIAIIGAGFSGLGTAIRLRQQGIDDFVVLERHEDVGGTWWANTYPGCACDVPSHLYSLSFAPNPEWTQTYSPQPEIRAYLQRLAREHDLYRSIRVGTTVTAADWDDDAGRWHLATSAGPISARVLIAGMGSLAEPRLPDLPGLETFEGAVFHSARWNHAHDVSGERVAAIGTGASAIQFVPAIQPTVAALHVFQRTAPWVVPHTNRRISRAERRLYGRVPALQKAIRAGIYATRELLVLGFVKEPRLMRIPERLARRHMREQLSDPDLRARVTPDYTIGCKRILPSNQWYPALAQPNVELVTSPIREVRARSLVTADGSVRPVDTIIFGTGFHVTDIPIADRIRGRDGQTLSQTWGGTPAAYKGSAVAGYPNLFFLVGPNTGLGHNSIVFMIEAQIEYLTGALRALTRNGARTLEVRPEAQAAYNVEIDRMTDGTVWVSGGCKSWYIDANGHNSTLWPTFTWPFRQRLREFDVAAYALGAAAPEPVALAA